MRTTYRHILSLLCLLALSIPAIRAQETKAKPVDPVFPYVLTIAQPQEGGTLSVTIPGANGSIQEVTSGQMVYQGTPVTLTFTASPGYGLKEGSMKYNDTALTPTHTPVTGNQWTASFEMAATPVTVSAEPGTIMYMITLPSLTGATTDPGAGTYTVVGGANFSFTLILDKDYDLSDPVVSASGTTLMPDADGTYTVSNVNADLVVTITGIVENNTTGIGQIDNTTLVRTEGNALLIRTPTPVKARVIALVGTVSRTIALTSGDNRIDGLASGIYIVHLSNGVTKKVIIR